MSSRRLTIVGGGPHAVCVRAAACLAPEPSLTCESLWRLTKMLAKDMREKWCDNSKNFSFLLLTHESEEGGYSAKWAKSKT